MGNTPQPHPDMGRLRVETYADIFRLGPIQVACTRSSGQAPGEDLYVVAFRYDDIGSIIAACEQAGRVHRGGEAFAWVDRDGDPVSPIPPPVGVRSDFLSSLTPEDLVLLLTGTAPEMAETIREIAGAVSVPIPAVQRVLTAVERHSPDSHAVQVLRSALAGTESEYADQLRAAGVVIKKYAEDRDDEERTR